VTNASRPLGLSRRHVLAGLAGAPALSASFPAAAQTAGPRWTQRQTQAALKGAKGTKLVLLGTGAGPVPGRSRRMTSHVMLSNGSAYVLDCGMGVTDQYARTGIPFSALRSIFITHHHPTIISNTARCWSSAGSRVCHSTFAPLVRRHSSR
jgi:glyoxylase-like metal-dependent hydrolase (beta-lactamase superfamily II)